MIQRFAYAFLVRVGLFMESYDLFVGDGGDDVANILPSVWKLGSDQVFTEPMVMDSELHTYIPVPEL